MKQLRPIIAKLRVMLANAEEIVEQPTQLEIPLVKTFNEDSFDQELKSAGFLNQDEAKEVAAFFKGRQEQLVKLSGGLKDNRTWHNIIQEQLETGKVKFEYSSRLHLGRMRAFVALVALRNGYKCNFRKNAKGDPVFNKEFVHPAFRDDHPTIYSVEVHPYNKRKEQAFFALSKEARKKLLKLI